MSALALAVLLVAPVEAPAQVGRAHVEAPAISRVWLRGAGLASDALAVAVAARLADKQVLGAGAEAGPIAGLVALCHVGVEKDALRLEVVLSDGRVYQRTIAAPVEGRERTAARLIAATIAAIEDESATPDRRDGVFVAPDAAPAEEAALVPETPVSTAPGGTTGQRGPPVAAAPVIATARRGQPAAGAPRIATEPPGAVKSGSATEQPGAAAPGSATEPVAVKSGSATDPVAVKSTSATEPPVVVTSRAPLELGLALDGGVAFGLGAPAAGLGLAGGGGGVRLDLRLRGGATLGAGFRGLGRARDGLGLGRYRGALVAGYVLRRRALEVSALAGLSLETWQVRERGVPVAYAAAGPGGASLLLGGLARVAVGGRLTAGRSAALRLGVYTEIAGSARSSGRAAQVARRHEVVPVFVLGGVELAIGLELELWFALRQVARRSTVSR